MSLQRISQIRSFALCMERGVFSIEVRMSVHLEVPPWHILKNPVQTFCCTLHGQLFEVYDRTSLKCEDYMSSLQLQCCILANSVA